MTEVVEERSGPHHFLLMIIQIDLIRDSPSDVQSPERVLEACVDGTGIDDKRVGKLVNASQSEERRGFGEFELPIT